ncbi:tyrosine-type recombinase/integrase [Nonomuraea helvata]|uniref:tyrosine-type recombinase/integrase n=1 Tax=Nonomuraea helvata TaxID=37484 RepID=UPI0031EEFFB4
MVATSAVRHTVTCGRRLVLLNRHGISARCGLIVSRPAGTGKTIAIAQLGRALLASAGLRDGRLHDARHTAATVLLVLGVPERTVMAIMEWSSSGMARRYQHVTDGIRNTVAKQVDGLLWETSKEGDESSEEVN